jgi:hypothetical protein
MSINWSAVSAICELVGAVTVIVSLLYVAFQLRQSTKAIVANSRQGLLDCEMTLLGDYITHAIDPHLIGDEIKLKPEDERRFIWIVIKALRIREAAWHQYRLGTLDEDSWNSYMAPVAGIFSTRRARKVLDFYVGAPAFMSLIRERLTDLPEESASG